MRLRLPAAVLLLCVWSSLLAQTSAQSPDNATAPAQSAPQTKPPKPPPANAAITGTVFCSDTHHPARGAVVMAQPIPKSGHPDTDPTNTSTSRVGMDGTYTIKHLRPGDYSIIALLPGYISPLDDLSLDQANNDTEMRARLARNGIVSIGNDETAHFDVTLERGATISGRVLYDDGAPATQITLNLEDVNAKPPASNATPGVDVGMIGVPNVSAGAFVRSFFLHQSQGTDDQGNFRISGIKPGTYRVAATLSTGADTSDPEEGLELLLGAVASPRSLRVYSGDTLHKNAAKTYNLRAGDEVNGIEITIPVYAFHRVEGHLTTLDGHPILTADIALTDTSDDSFALRARLARDGSFVFPEVPAGNYKLAVSGAKIGTGAENLPENFPLDPGNLHDIRSFADTTTTILVKDADITDLSIQLPDTKPTANQSPSTATSQ